MRTKTLTSTLTSNSLVRRWPTVAMLMGITLAASGCFVQARTRPVRAEVVVVDDRPEERIHMLQSRSG